MRQMRIADKQTHESMPGREQVEYPGGGGDGGDGMIQKYVNFSQLIDWLKSLSLNRTVNKDPYMDNALLNMRQILEFDIYNPCLFHYIEVGGCDDCRWRNRPQKCSCCRRNLHIKDCYEKEAQP